MRSDVDRCSSRFDRTPWRYLVLEGVAECTRFAIPSPLPTRGRCLKEGAEKRHVLCAQRHPATDSTRWEVRRVLCLPSTRKSMGVRDWYSWVWLRVVVVDSNSTYLQNTSVLSMQRQKSITIEMNSLPPRRAFCVRVDVGRTLKDYSPVGPIPGLHWRRARDVVCRRAIICPTGG